MLAGTAVYGTVRTVVWEDGGGDPASYPIGVLHRVNEEQGRAGQARIGVVPVISDRIKAEV